MTDNDHEGAMAFMQGILDSLREAGGGKRGLDLEAVSELVRDDPESAAKVVLAFCRQETLDPPFTQIALSIALAYEQVLGDDSLKEEILQAPWASKVRPPRIVFSDKEPEPEPVSDPLLDHEGIRVLQVDHGDLQTGSVENFREAFAIEGCDAERVRKLKTLWGMCLFTFPLSEDPRYIWEIPEARRFTANLHAAMPYFPCYLNFRQEFGMFLTYFGCLADPEAFAGGVFNLEHPSVYLRVVESLVAIGVLSQTLATDPRPVWRTILSGYPPLLAEEFVRDVYDSLQK